MSKPSDQITSIQFGPHFPPLSYYDGEIWEIMERHLVEFYPNKWYDVILISTETPNFMTYLSECESGEPISLDLEWESELCLFQFCFQNKVVIVRHPNGEGNNQLLQFLLTHKFYAKGIHNDKKQLQKKFNTYEIANNIEDIAKTRLVPYNYSEKFMEMVRQFSGEPTAEFKDIKITTSNWELPKLTKRQILYAAFDVVSLKECYPNYPPPKQLIKGSRGENSNADDVENAVRKHKRIRSSLITSEMIHEHIAGAKKSISSSAAPASSNFSSTLVEKVKKNVKLKRSPAREITGFTVRGYKGTKNIYSIKQMFCINSEKVKNNEEKVENDEERFENDEQKVEEKVKSEVLVKDNAEKLKDDDEKVNNEDAEFLDDDFSNIDFCSTFEDYLFIGFFKFDEASVIEKLNSLGSKVIKIDPSYTTKYLHINADESTDGDVLFIQNISEHLISNFNDLLYCFGTNHEFNSFHDEESSLDYVRVEPRESTSSYRIKLFLSKFEYEGKTPIVSDFPYFLSKVRVNDIPSFYGEEDLRALFSKAGRITKIEILRRRIEQDKQTAFITYKTTEEADEAVRIFNHAKLEKDGKTAKSDFNSNMEMFLNNNLSSIASLNNELKVFRYSDEPHLRFMRRYELRDTRVDLFNSDSNELEKLYSKYGRIHLCFFDPFFNVGRVQFYDKKDALIASAKEKSETTEESKTIVIRDLSFETTDSEILKLCSPFGTIVNLITRDINSIMRFIIKDVSFSTTEEANKAKAFFSTVKMIHGVVVRVAVLNGGFSFAPDWKMRQRKHWIKFVSQKPNDEFFDKASKNGRIVKVEYKIQNTKIVIPYSDQKSGDAGQSNNSPVITPITVTAKQEVTFLMFQDFDSTSAYGDMFFPTIDEFVELLNPNELYIDIHLVKTESSNEKDNSQPEEKKPVKMAIVIDPIPDFVSKKLLVDYIGEFAENCQVFISPSMLNKRSENAEEENPSDEKNSSIENNLSDEKNSSIENKIYDEKNSSIENKIYDGKNSSIENKIYDEKNSSIENNLSDEKSSSIENNLSDEKNSSIENKIYDEKNSSDDDEEEEEEEECDEKLRRAVLVPVSRTLTNKIYSMMNDRPIEDESNSELLKPIRMRFEKVPNKPKIKPKEIFVVKQKSKKMTIVVDPLPATMEVSDIENICGNFGKFSLTITGSSVIKGRRRALIHPLSCRSKKHIFRCMSTVFDGEEMVPIRLFPKDIPPPL